MSHRYTVALRIGLCCTLSACDRVATSDLTEPEAVTPDLAAGNTWTAGTSLSPWRWSMAAGSAGGVMYVVGGRSRNGTAQSRVDAYNIGTGTWSSVAPLPRSRSNPNGASMIAGKLYVSGGLDGNGVRTRTLFVYDPAANRWTRKADVPQPSCGGAQHLRRGQQSARRV
jgi:N-acetylneuraminic acid mutarotase